MEMWFQNFIHRNVKHSNPGKPSALFYSREIIRRLIFLETPEFGRVLTQDEM